MGNRSMTPEPNLNRDRAPVSHEFPMRSSVKPCLLSKHTGSGGALNLQHIDRILSFIYMARQCCRWFTLQFGTTGRNFSAISFPGPKIIEMGRANPVTQCQMVIPRRPSGKLQLIAAV